MEVIKKPLTMKKTSTKIEPTRTSLNIKVDNFSMSHERKRAITEKKQDLKRVSLFSRDSQICRNLNENKGNATPVPSTKKRSELPEIYNPILTKKQNSSVNFIGALKLDHHLQSMEKYSCQNIECVSSTSRVHFPRRSRWLQLTEIENPKQMSRDKKNELFKIIRNQFHELINTSNLLSVKNHSMNFRAYIEKGNNGLLIKEIIKRRCWWHIEDDPQKANLIWTQWYNRQTLLDLPDSPLKDQKIAVEEYRGNHLIEGDTKSRVIGKLLDKKTFSKIQQKIVQEGNHYFQQMNDQKVSNLLKKTEFSEEMKILNANQPQKIHNHVEGCLNLHSKKLLFANFQNFMKEKKLDPFQFIPLTFYIDNIDSESFNDLLSKFDQFQRNKEFNEKNVWICKPGENSNRGNGIRVFKNREQLIQDLQGRLNSNSGRTVIVQKYIEKCYLIKNRKFDLRCYILITTVNGILKGYWYQDGYIRTSSKQYSLDNVEDILIHLTNDAIQKKGDEFGKHEDFNKMSFDGFKQYLKKMGVDPAKFDQTYEQMKLISYYLIASVSSKIKRKQFTFQLFGLDFMLDDNLTPFLIQANSNPCLDSKGKILGKIIYELIDNVILTAIDPIFPPPTKYKKKSVDFVSKDYFETNKFELIFAGKQLLKVHD